MSETRILNLVNRLCDRDDEYLAAVARWRADTSEANERDKDLALAARNAAFADLKAAQRAYRAERTPPALDTDTPRPWQEISRGEAAERFEGVAS